MAELPSDDELLAAVRDAGWLLEHHAVRTLSAAGMYPRAGWAFQDPDEPTKSRELDVWSFQQLLCDERNKVYVTARFLVECKQSSNPYVGVGYDMPDARFRGNPAEHVLPRREVHEPTGQDGSYRLIPAWSHFGFDELARQHGSTNFRVTQLTRLDRGNGGMWAANNSGIFTSLVYPLAKALLISKKDSQLNSPAGIGGAANRVGWLDFALHFPVGLISCPLYVVDATATDPTVECRPWVTATRELKSQTVKGTFDIDIVTESAFADYVADRLAFASAFADVVEEDPLKFTGEDQPPG